jgi:hypothetical protein
LCSEFQIGLVVGKTVVGRRGVESFPISPQWQNSCVEDGKEAIAFFALIVGEFYYLDHTFF